MEKKKNKRLLHDTDHKLVIEVLVQNQTCVYVWLKKNNKNMKEKLYVREYVGQSVIENCQQEEYADNFVEYCQQQNPGIPYPTKLFQCKL